MSGSPSEPPPEAAPATPDPGLEAARAAAANAEEAFETVDPQDEESGLPFRRAGKAERTLISSLSGVLRVAKLHALDNVVFVEALQEFVAALKDFVARKEHATIIWADKQVAVNGAVLKQRRGGRSWLQEFTEVMERFGIHGLVFKGSWGEASARQFVECFKNVPAKEPAERCAAIAEAARQIPEPARADVLNPEEIIAYTTEGEEETLSDGERAAFYYARLVALAEASHVAVVHDRSPDFHVRHIRQTFIKILEYLRTGLFELRLLGLTVLPPLAQDELASHTTNVSIFSLGIGRLLGLPRGPLADLAFAAFYHDLGRAGAKRQASARDPTRESRTVAEADIVRGVSYALRGKGYGEAGLLRVIAVAEHHRATDRYPHATGLRAPHLFSRVIGVADAFDKLQFGTPWCPAVSPARALRQLQEDEKRFEPAIVAVLRDLVGRTPRGTLLRLKDDSVVVVIDGGARRGHRPVARRLFLPGGAPDDRRTILEIGSPDLVAAELDPSSVSVDWRRAVVA